MVIGNIYAIGPLNGLYMWKKNWLNPNHWVMLSIHKIMLTTTQVNSALHPSGFAKSSTSLGWGKGGKVTLPDDR